MPSDHSDLPVAPPTSRRLTVAGTVAGMLLVLFGLLTDFGVVHVAPRTYLTVHKIAPPPPAGIIGAMVAFAGLLIILVVHRAKGMARTILILGFGAGYPGN